MKSQEYRRVCDATLVSSEFNRRPAMAKKATTKKAAAKPAKKAVKKSAKKAGAGK